MTLCIGLISQKGGVGKSTIARCLAREYANNNWNVKIADMDISQGTSFNWNNRRRQHSVKPDIDVQQYPRVDVAMKNAADYDMIIFDGAPHGSEQTLKIAQVCHMVIIPTGTPLDDLEPTIKLCHELKGKGIEKKKITIVLCRTGESDAEILEAKEYIEQSGYFLLNGDLPEKTSYKRASDFGKVCTETPFKSIKDRADTLMQAIIDHIGKITK